MKSWRVSEYREALDVGVVWVIVESHGMCGCGQCEMTGRIAFFVDRYDADMFVADKEERQRARAQAHGERPQITEGSTKGRVAN